MKVDSMEAKAVGSGRVLKKNHRKGTNKSGEPYEVHELVVGYFGGKIHLRIEADLYSTIEEGQNVEWRADLEERSFKLHLSNIELNAVA